MRSKTAGWALVTTIATGVLATLAGCTASSKYMQPVTGATPLRPPPGQAMVVFLRPSRFATAIKFTLLTTSGRFLGDSVPKSHFAVALPPGRHVFLIWAENTAALRADLAAGRTYYVEVSAKMGVLSARGHLLAITRRNDRWAKLGSWLQETKRLQPNVAAGQAYIDSRAEDKADRIRRAMENLSGYDQSELAERTIVAGDGTGGGQVGQPTPVASPAPPPGGFQAPAPPPPLPTTPTPAARHGVGRQCSKDVDCPGEEICRSGVCAASAARHRAPRAAGCTKDIDCPGQLVCNRGKCMAQSRQPAAVAARSVPGRPKVECAVDKQCPGKKICEKGRCLAPDEMSPAELRRRATAGRRARAMAMADERRKAAEARRLAAEEKRRQAAAERRARIEAAQEKRRQAAAERQARIAAARQKQEERRRKAAAERQARVEAKRRKQEERRRRIEDAKKQKRRRIEDAKKQKEEERRRKNGDAQAKTAKTAAASKLTADLSGVLCHGGQVYRDGACQGDPAPPNPATKGPACNYGDLAGCTTRCQARHAKSCYNLGSMYYFGKGVGKDLAQARTHYTSACRGGSTRSCANLAYMYESAMGGPKNLPLAVALYELTCKKGAKRSCHRVAVYYREGLAVKRDLARARALFADDCKTGGKRGKRLSCNALGEMMRQGLGGTKDYPGAQKMFMRACTAGPEGCANLGWMFCRGEGSAKSPSQCRRYLQKACAGGYTDACGKGYQ